MFTEKHFPTSITDAELDEYLEKGWYRMGQAIFTCHFLFFQDSLYSPIWIRLPLNGYSFRKRLRKLYNKTNRNFKVKIGPAELTLEKELLYQKYRANFDGHIAPTLQDSLFDGGEFNIYQTNEVTVYNGKKLIAFSFFDMGGKSVASIKGVFDPAFSKHSLGIFTMLEEIKYAQKNGCKYYYPGYVVPGYPKFDYKLVIGEKDEIEFYDLKSGQWMPYDSFNPKSTPVEILSEKLLKLGHRISSLDISCQVLFYPAYDASVFEHTNERFLESPLFLNIFNNVFPRPRFIVFYDMWKEKFIFCHCLPIDDFGFYFNYLMHYDTSQGKHFLDFILKKSQIIETENIDEIAELAINVSKYLRPPSQISV